MTPTSGMVNLSALTAKELEAYNLAKLFISDHRSWSVQSLIEYCMKIYQPYGCTIPIIGRAFHDYITSNPIDS